MAPVTLYICHWFHFSSALHLVDRLQREVVFTVTTLRHIRCQCFDKWGHTLQSSVNWDVAVLSSRRQYICVMWSFTAQLVCRMCHSPYPATERRLGLLTGRIAR